mgnify:CR=1 FL=1
MVTSTPTPTTFTYVAKPNLVVQNTGLTSLYANVTAFPQGLVKHRPLDGGNNIGGRHGRYGFVGEQLLWLGRRTERDGRGHPRWDDHRVDPGSDACPVESKRDGGVGSGAELRFDQQFVSEQ